MLTVYDLSIYIIMSPVFIDLPEQNKELISTTRLDVSCISLDMLQRGLY